MESIPKDTLSHVNDSIQADNLIKKCLLKNVDKLCNDAAKLSSLYEKNLQSCGKSLQKRSSILSKYASALFVKQSELSNAISQLKKNKIKYRNDDKKLRRGKDERTDHSMITGVKNFFQKLAKNIFKR